MKKMGLNTLVSHVSCFCCISTTITRQMQKKPCHAKHTDVKTSSLPFERSSADVKRKIHLIKGSPF